MRHLIWYIMSAFCKHDWKYEQEHVQVKNLYGNISKQGDKVSATCNKCGWHRKYWKHI